MYRRLAAVTVVSLSVACGGTTSSPAIPTQTAQPLAAPAVSRTESSGFGAIASSGPSLAQAVADFATCLASPTAGCFSATRVRARVVGPVPNPPTNLVATVVGSNVTLQWTPGVSGDPVFFVIEAGSQSGAADLATVRTPGSPFSASGVGAGTYYVRVRATSIVNGATSGPSNEVIVVVGGGPCVAPGAPGALTVVSNSGGTVVLSWTAASGAPTSYIVEAGSSPGQANLANSDLGPTTTLTATGVGAGTYYVRIRAKNACGTSGPSNEIQLVVGTTSTGFAGTWSGTTQQGRPVALTVNAANQVTAYSVGFVGPANCPTWSLFTLAPALGPLTITNGFFTTPSSYTGGNINGTFTSSTAASGTATAHLSASGCPAGTVLDYSTTWTATKQ